MAQEFETLIDVFDASTRKFADRPLFGTKRNGNWQWTTYREFENATHLFRGGLAKAGVVKGDRVSIISNNRVEWAVAAYACFGLGAAFVPMYEAQSEKDWDFIVKDAGAKVLICATDAIVKKCLGLLESAPELKHIVSFDPATKTDDHVHSYQQVLDAGEDPAPPMKPTAADVACYIYTSGTTGDPKGVILSHGNFASNVSACKAIFPLGGEDRSLSFLPWAHSFGQTGELHLLISHGASLAICESVDKLLDNLVEVQPTMLMSVPRIFNKLYTAVQKTLSEKPGVIQALVRAALKAKAKLRDGEKLGLAEGLIVSLADRLVFGKVRQRFGGRLKYAVSGGAAISREVAEFIDGLGVTVFEGYGLSETSPVSSVNYPGHRRIGSVGQALPGVTIDIEGSGGVPNKEGEIIIHGPNVMVGYYNRPAETASVFTADRGFKTGDLGRLDEDGFLFITGRIKEQYKLENGKYVVPTPLEEQLKLSPLVANVLVYGDNKPFNVALVVANMDALRHWADENGVPGGSDEALIAEPKVRKRFNEEIAKYGEHFKGFEGIKDFALIAEDFTTDNGMLTPSLKVKRRKVVEKWGSLLDSLYAKKKESKAQAASSAA